MTGMQEPDHSSGPRRGVDFSANGACAKAAEVCAEERRARSTYGGALPKRTQEPGAPRASEMTSEKISREVANNAPALRGRVVRRFPGRSTARHQGPRRGCGVKDSASSRFAARGKASPPPGSRQSRRARGSTDGVNAPWLYCCCGTRTGGHFATALSISSAVSSGLIVTRANPAAFVLNWAVAAATSSG
jgi:hypothetical protein